MPTRILESAVTIRTFSVQADCAVSCLVAAKVEVRGGTHCSNSLLMSPWCLFRASSDRRSNRGWLEDVGLREGSGREVVGGGKLFCGW